jgi:hypothetical protein
MTDARPSPSESGFPSEESLLSQWAHLLAAHRQWEPAARLLTRGARPQGRPALEAAAWWLRAGHVNDACAALTAYDDQAHDDPMRDENRPVAAAMRFAVDALANSDGADAAYRGLLALASAPDSPELVQHVAVVVADRLGDSQRAVLLARRLLTRRGDDPDLLVLVAAGLAAEGEAVRAAEITERAWELRHPNEPEPIDAVAARLSGRGSEPELARYLAGGTSAFDRAVWGARLRRAFPPPRIPDAAVTLLAGLLAGSLWWVTGSLLLALPAVAVAVAVRWFRPVHGLPLSAAAAVRRANGVAWRRGLHAQPEGQPQLDPQNCTCAELDVLAGRRSRHYVEQHLAERTRSETLAVRVLQCPTTQRTFLDISDRAFSLAIDPPGPPTATSTAHG